MFHPPQRRDSQHREGPGDSNHVSEIGDKDDEWCKRTRHGELVRWLPYTTTTATANPQALTDKFEWPGWLTTTYHTSKEMASREEKKDRVSSQPLSWEPHGCFISHQLLLSNFLVIAIRTKKNGMTFWLSKRFVYMEKKPKKGQIKINLTTVVHRGLCSGR